MNRGKSKSDLPKTWLGFPPIISTPLLLLLATTGSSLRATSVPSAIWGVAFVGYVFMCVAFVGFMKARNKGAAIAASTVAQGLIFSIFSLSWGANPALSWGGIFILIIGGILAVQGFYVPHTFSVEDILFAEKTTPREVKEILYGLPLPSFLLDENERIVAINSDVETILGHPEKAILGKTLADFSAFDKEKCSLVVNEHEWAYHITNKNARSLVVLSPRVYEAISATGNSILNIIDAETGLYTKDFIQKKGSEEIERSQRYNRRLTVMLTQLFCEEGASTEEERRAYNSLAAATGLLIRSCDVAFKLDDHQMLLFLPDTPVAGARRLAERITADIERLSAIESVMPSGCHIESGISSYIGKGAHTVESVLEDVKVDLKKSIAASNQSGTTF